MNIRELLSEQEIAEYKANGYTEQDIQQAINTSGSQSPLQQSYAQTQQMGDPRSSASSSIFTAQNQDNLIKWQLEVDSILERVEHMIKGDKIQFKEGHIIWLPTKDTKDRIFNDYGTSELMRILSLYINRNTILSNYDEETINDKMLDLGNEMADLIYLKYESFGLDDLEKRKMYPMIVRQITDAVHSAYLRALNGGERQSLHEARTVTQSEPLSPGVNINTGQQRERGMLNPMRYVFGRFK